MKLNFALLSAFRNFRSKTSLSSIMRNVEVKGRLAAGDLERLLDAAASASDLGHAQAVLHQRDSYYEAARGRLKLRRQTEERHDSHVESSAQLVQYERADADGPKLSDYGLCRMDASCADSLHEVLARALGHRGDVVKRRRLFLVGQTRVHVDEVEGLGDFFEFEVVMRPEQTVEEGEKIADELLEKLKLSKDSLLSKSYVDFLLDKQKRGS